MRKALGIDVGDIGHSLRFRSSASAYLSRTFGTPTSSSVFTLSLWVKRGGLTGTFRLFGASTTTYLTFNSSDQLNLTLNGASACTSTAVFRDPTAHYHIVYQQNGSAQTLYVNSVSVATGTTAAAIFNTAIAHQLGAANTSNYLDGYLSRVCFVDGTALTPSSFGYLNTSINEWVSNSQSVVKTAVDAGGTNSFMLDFDDNTSLTTLGYDKSSKGNNWTCNNISLTAGGTYDWMLDVPGNSYSTLSPIAPIANGTISAANLTYTTGNADTFARGTICVSSGKWYYEATNTNNTATPILGIAKTSVGSTVELRNAGTGNAYSYLNTGFKSDGSGGSGTSYGATFTTNDVIGVVFDLDAGTITFYKQTGGTGSFVSQGTAYSGISGEFAPAIGDAAGASGGQVWDINFGQRPFNNTSIPTGFKALCQANLSDTGTVTVSGSFTGNANADGPVVWMNGVPKTLTINSNAVTFGTHADKIAGGFKLRTSSSSYNASGSNTWTATIDSNIQNIFKYNNAEGNP